MSRIVTTFAQPVRGATGNIIKGDDGRYFWQIAGIGLGGPKYATELVECPFKIPHDDFAARLAWRYFCAIVDEVGGGEYGTKTALRMLFGYDWQGKNKE